MSDKNIIEVPDLGDFSDVEIIEILVAVGDQIGIEQPLLTLESDKATLEVPADKAGTVTEIKVALGTRVNQGDAIIVIDADAATGAATEADSASAETDEEPEKEDDSAAQSTTDAAETSAAGDDSQANSAAGSAANDGTETPSTAAPSKQAAEQAAFEPPKSLPPPVDRANLRTPHASPSIRRFARELGADLQRIDGSGNKGRILREDVVEWVKLQLNSAQASAAPAGGGIPPIPSIDFSQFGDTETVKLSRIKRLSGPHLHRAWLNIPHVTHNDDADITDLEAFRKSLKGEGEKRDVKVTILAFIMKALTKSLEAFSNVNSSLSEDGESLILKHYCHIGVAVDTPNGLVVPVVRDVDKKGVFDIAKELGEVSTRARDSKLTPDDMKGGCISISSLGGIGGTAFTPVVNAPEVAILGVCRSSMQPVWNGSEFVPRMILPLSLSYDHRVIDGAEAARFMVHLKTVLGDLKRALL